MEMTKMGVMEITEVGAKTFINEKDAVIYVYQDNCAPCVKFAPIFLEASDKLPDVKFGKLKLPKDEASEFKRKWLKVGKDEKPWGTPVVLVFKDGERIAIKQGAELFDVNNLAVFVETGEMPKPPVNPLLADITEEQKAVYVEKSKKMQELKAAQIEIQKLSTVIDSGQATDEHHALRGIYFDKAKEIAASLDELNKIKAE